jgi:hypothetical protein
MKDTWNMATRQNLCHKKSGEDNCPDCVQQESMLREKEQKKVLCWEAVGHNFKSPPIQYKSGNSNSKMALQVHRDQIIGNAVKFWPSIAVLEEDGDSGHGNSEKNIVTT